MNCIVKPNAHDHALRVHARLAGSKTRCGILIESAQEEIGRSIAGAASNV